MQMLSFFRKPIVEIFGWAGVGAGLAIAIDYAVSRDASLLFSVTQYVDRLLSAAGPYTLSLRLAFFILLGIGASSIFYFRPLSRKGAFGGGFGAIGALAILLP